MLSLGNVTVNNFDLALLVAYALLCLINSKALLPIAAFVVYVAIHSLPIRNFDAYIACSTLCTVLVLSNIKLSLEIRKAFTCFSVIYLLSAVDNFISYHFDVDSGLDQILKPAVVIINAYLLAFLFDDWRRGNAVGLSSYCAFWLRQCKMYFIHSNQVQRVKK